MLQEGSAACNSAGEHAKSAIVASGSAAVHWAVVSPRPRPTGRTLPTYGVAHGPGRLICRILGAAACLRHHVDVIMLPRPVLQPPAAEAHRRRCHLQPCVSSS